MNKTKESNYKSVGFSGLKPSIHSVSIANLKASQNKDMMIIETVKFFEWIHGFGITAYVLIDINRVNRLDQIQSVGRETVKSMIQSLLNHQIDPLSENMPVAANIYERSIGETGELMLEKFLGQAKYNFNTGTIEWEPAKL